MSAIKLNPDQEKAKQFLKRWWGTGSRFAILEGRAGTGKTTILAQLVRELKGCDPLFTAPTNEACKQLELALPPKTPVKTTYSALGFNFDTGKEEKELVQGRVNPILDQINLLVIDECSMCSSELIEAAEETGKYVLFVGHRSQLPSVTKNLSVFDECISPVFSRGYPIYTLTTPERNKGELFEFISGLESLIYTQPRFVKPTYSKPMDYLHEYIQTKEGQQELLKEESKVICWSNVEVDALNKEIRKAVFRKSDLPQFVLRDRIVVTEPVSWIAGENISGFTKNKLGSYMNSDIVKTYSANSKAIVRGVKQTTLLHVPCWELELELGNERPLIYVPISEAQYMMVRQGLVDECFSYTTKQAKSKAWQRFHFLMSMFAKVKHSYAITTHRSQGMTIPKVFVNWKDIRQCSNVYMKHKLLYVAASRARDELTLIG